MSPQAIFVFLTTIIATILNLTTCAEFVFNTNFNSTNILTYGNATIEHSSILSLAEDTIFSIGRALYPSKITTMTPNLSIPLSFSTSFIFSVSPNKNFLPGHGFVFVFMPSTGMEGASSAQHLGLFNLTNDGDINNHVFGVEFDTFMNQEFNDINDNHVAIDVNSLTSIVQREAGYWEADDSEFKKLKLNNAVNYQVWIDYVDSRINITMAEAGVVRPKTPLMTEYINLSSVFLDEMYVGFVGATGRLVQNHRILSWSFSNSNFSISDALVTQNLPFFVPLSPKKSVFQSEAFIAGVNVSCLLVFVLGASTFVVSNRRKKKKEKERMEDWEMAYWPHRIDYQVIYAATKGFNEEKVIGLGGNGKVYKGTLEGVEVAIKTTSLQTERGLQEWLAEVSSLGRLKHRNLVGVKGWCKKEKGSLFLVYDYMDNGSLDKRIFNSNETCLLSWQQRIKVLKDVANGILYLHEGWESKVVHRDIKASNVLLDKNMNARLGDFGLAKMHHHKSPASTTSVVGAAGYIAPEIIRTGRASTKTDVFSFGVLILEVVCGRRPIEEGTPNLVGYVWRLYERGEINNALDEKLKQKGGYRDEEIERVIQLGLLCAYHEPNVRPTMRQVVKVLEGSSESSNETQEEGIGVHLLASIMSGNGMWSRLQHNFGGGREHGHPTLDQILMSLTSPLSLVTSDLIIEGR